MRLTFDNFEIRMNDPEPQLCTALHFAVHQHGLSFGQTTDQEVRRTIPDELYQSAIILESSDEHLAAATGNIAGLQTGEAANDVYFFTGPGIGNLMNFAPVFVAKRQMIKQIFDGAQT